MTIGLDFGTTTMVAATGRGEQASLLKTSRGDKIVPSVVAFTPSGRVEVGRAAKARRVIDPKNTLYSVKRILGKTWLSVEVSEFRRAYPFEIERGEDRLPRFVTRAGKLTAVEVAARLLEAVRDLLLPATEAPDDVRLTVPASFDDMQRAATVEAAERAGFPGVKVLDEPHAAALAYRRYLPDASTLAVYDLGGGTFDLAVLDVAADRIEMRASGGDAYLGGDDVDSMLAEWAVEQILERYRWDVRSNAQSFQALLFACERAKMRLSEVNESAIPLGQVDQVLAGKDLLVERSRVESLAHSLVQRTFVTCDDVFARARIDPKSIDAVILAGGGSYMPFVRDTVEHYFGQEPLGVLPPDHLVALGAALWGS